MKRFGLFIILAAFLVVPGAFAQEISDHFNVGVFGNYVNDGNLNLAGVGARLSFNVPSSSATRGGVGV
jgi:hypothetical protein